MTNVLKEEKTMTSEVLSLVKEFEGYYSKAYLCPAGVLTIGYGHTKNVKRSDTVNMTIAHQLLMKDLFECKEEVEKIYGVHSNVYFMDMLTSFCFNCGGGNLKTLVKGRTPLSILRKILLYDKCNGKPLKGLTRRRKAEQLLGLTFYKNQSKKNYDEITTKIIQELLSVKVDGYFGEKTEKAVKEYQRKNGLLIDGIVGIKTWFKLIKEV